MSGIFVVAPVLAVAPVVFSATTAAAAALGFSMISGKMEQFGESLRGSEEAARVVQFDVADAHGLTQLVNEQGPITLQRDDATMCFHAAKGRVQLTVTAKSALPEEALEALGRSMLGAMSQQYAYHAVVSDLKSRGFDKVEETKDEDGTIRLRLRRWD